MRAFIETICIFIFVLKLNVESHKIVVAVDEQWVCNIKKSCLECLRLSHCSWCQSANKCFSSKLQANGFCENNTVVYKDYGLSIEDNASCECAVESNERETLCRPPGAPDTEPECSGRGECRCGRCLCPAPDPDQPTKMVMGEYCEFDNFSCDGPECGEGPYPLVPAAPDAPESAVETAAEPDVMDSDA